MDARPLQVNCHDGARAIPIRDRCALWAVTAAMPDAGPVEADLRRLRVFLAVADTLHFGRAGERLRLAQPSISQQVARLERQLGLRLFVRTPRGVTLTVAGERLVQHVGPAVRALDQALETFAAAGGDQTLRVGALSSLASSLVPSAVPDVSTLASRVSINEGSLSQLLQRLLAGDLDVVFCYATADARVLDGGAVQRLDERPTQVAMPATDPLAGCDEIAWAEAAARPWVMPSASRHYYEDMLERFTRRGLEARVVAEATTLSGQLALVAAGIGWTFTSPWTPVPAGVQCGTLADGDRIELLAVTRTLGLGVHGRALIDAVAARAVAFGS
ncbi:MAG: LysR family transcriptional regulator [Jatrophihabitans sp.]